MTFEELGLLFGHTNEQTDSVVHGEVALPINIMAQSLNGTLEQHFGDVYKKNVALYKSGYKSKTFLVRYGFNVKAHFKWVMRTKISQVVL